MRIDQNDASGRHRGPAWARGAGVVAILAILAWADRAGAESGPVPDGLRREGIRWPGEGGNRIRVSLGIYIVDFARINLREESFDMAGYLDTSWTDPTIALKGEERRGKVRRFRPGQIWSPALEFVNAVEQVVTEREGDLYVDDDGRATQRVRFSHKFQSPFHLARFPFDSQTLTIVIAPFDPFAKDLDLVIDEDRVGRLAEASVTDWDILDVEARVEPSGSGPGDERFLFQVKVDRRSTFFVWRVLLPMTLLVMASWTVFWFDVTVLQPQVSTGLAILLSLVTFTYAVDFSLPKVAYLTFIDRYTIMAFAFVLAVLLAVTVMHVVLRSRGPEAAARIQSRLRSAFPGAFLVAIITTACLTLL